MLLARLADILVQTRSPQIFDSFHIDVLKNMNLNSIILLERIDRQICCLHFHILAGIIYNTIICKTNIKMFVADNSDGKQKKKKCFKNKNSGKPIFPCKKSIYTLVNILKNF